LGAEDNGLRMENTQLDGGVLGTEQLRLSMTGLVFHCFRFHVVQLAVNHAFFFH